MDGHARSTLVSVLVALSFSTAPAQATLPGDVLIQYNIREIPTQALSNVVFNVAIDLAAVDEDGDDVAWSPTAITITQYDGQGGQIVWVEDTPSFDTVDGYWWVTHADTTDPQSEEFDMPPYMTGTADAEDPADDDLEYEVEGATCNAACQAMFSGHVAALDHWFKLVNESRSEEEGNDEPAEVPEGTE